MKIKEGDKFLCRKTHYMKGEHIWQIGKYYEIIIKKMSFDNRKYKITCESEVHVDISEKTLTTFFITADKKIRKLKLLNIKRKLDK